MRGAELIGDVLDQHGVRCLFTLCGGHISPILVAAKKRGIRVVDVRDEVTAVFAADAVGRLTGVPGVAAVTAGPGCTNTITAMKNAQMAESPVVLLGGATATMLRGRGALQDIDQLALFAPCTKWTARATKARELPSLLTEAFFRAKQGVPGPVFLECPVDLLYDPELVRSWYVQKGGGKSIQERALALYLRRHVDSLFDGLDEARATTPVIPEVRTPPHHRVRSAAEAFRKAERPVIVVGSQALAEPSRAADVARALEGIGAPVYLSGMARGLLGRHAALQVRHKRRDALKEADVVLLAGTPADFRLDYGRHISRKATYIAAGRDNAALHKNRWPQIAAAGDAGAFLVALCAELGGAVAASTPAPDRPADAPSTAVASLSRYAPWVARLKERDAARDAGIAGDAHVPGVDGVNPLAFCRALEEAMDEDAVIVADGGDFVATASYIVRPRAPLSWLDPGVFGTLGVGAGFALGAKMLRPARELWVVFGDGAFGWSMAELDTFARHGVPVIAVIGNDAGWTQIAREQVEMLKDDVGCVLARTDYDQVGVALGGHGVRIETDDDVTAGLVRAKELARTGKPVVVNVHLGKTAFRKGSISM